MGTEKRIGTIAVADIPSLRFRWLSFILFFLLFLIVLTGAVSIPFLFESQSILYKFGIDKIMLRTGKILGIVAVVLILIQILFSARLKMLDRIVALDRLYYVHRINAFLIVTLIFLHPILVLLPEGLTNISFDMRSWPEMVGVLLLLLLLSITVTGVWRLKLKIPFERWLFVHRLATFVVIVLVGLHVLYVSDTFKQPIPRLSVLLICGVYCSIFVWIRIKSKLLRVNPWDVSGVTALSKDTFLVELSLANKKEFSYLPGQFVFLSFASPGVPDEEHPFTISSTPTRSDTLSFTIRNCGDWTRTIDKLMVGDSAFVDGPYGKFSFLNERDCEIIMIAGGIGITPMLSMLRYMADTEEARKITLIWTNRTDRHLLYEDELDKLQNSLPGFHLINIFTRESTTGVESRRLNQIQLQTLVKDCDRRAAVFLCGPSPLMRSVLTWLPKIGFSRKNIHWEKFSL